ncbi:MAG: chromosome segregation protein SMC [bacterium]
MYLRKVEIIGFKSFAERTKLNFEPGITCIVGPNGCGKSNIVDAIRWCLGEQGAKSLRSHHMLDVVFNGTQKRAALGMGEVILTFDNTKNILPIDYSEITVSRRIFRSGESEYYLNKTQCRLKDIKDLFLDTGIGTEGYSVMEQGRVEFIFNSKPEERRYLFEEAAGVSKYKARREESLRKLEKIDFDLLRLNDSLTILRDQLRGLDSQARKAKNYQKLKEDLKNIEINELLVSFKAAESDISRIKKEFLTAQDTLQIHLTESDKTEVKLEECRLKLRETDEEYLKVQSESLKLYSEIETLENKEAAAKKMQESLEEKIVSLKEEIVKDEAEIDSLRVKQTSANNELEHLKKEVQSASNRLQDVGKQYSAVRSELDKKVLQKDELYNKSLSIDDSLRSINNDVAEHYSLKTHNQAELNSRQRELQKLEERINPQTSELEVINNKFKEEAEAASFFETVVADVVKKLESVKKNIDNLYSQVLNLEKEKSAVFAKIEAFNEMQKGDPYITGTKAIMNKGFEGIYGPIYKLFHTENDKVLSHYFGDQLNYLVAESAPKALEVINFLKENRLGRANFIILENLPSNEVEFDQERVEGRPYLIDTIGFDRRFLSLFDFLCAGAHYQDDTVINEVFMQGGSPVDMPLSYYERLKDSDILENRLQEINSEFESKSLILTEYEKESEELSKIKELKSTVLEEKKLGLSVLGQQRTSIEENIQRLSNEKRIIQTELEQIHKNRVKIESELNENIKSQEILKLERENMSREMSVFEENISTLRAEERKINEELTSVKIDYSSQIERIQSKESEREYINTQTERFVQFHSRKIEESANSVAERENQRNIQQQAALQVQEVLKKVEEVEKTVVKFRNERETLSEGIRLENEKLHSIKNELKKHQDSVHQLELKLTRNKDERDNIEKLLKQNYSMLLPDALNTIELFEVDLEEKTKLEKRIETLGAVNLAAPEEYVELTQRHDFLQSQMNDITKAKEDLLQAVSKINNITKSNFKDTFAKVRNNFQTIFKELFKGGEADIILTDENNLLETGVDIIAQPPGKKLLNIMVLSGGEKALTAIALLFAFYMVRPSPFCILDEVDAPLDDANIGRFTALVEGFTHQSQFLMITHSKRTMEIADALYGITMEEFGVSKMISMKMAKEDKESKDELIPVEASY